MSLTRRTQVLLDDDRYRLLRRRARATGSSVGALIRDAIDRAYADERSADALRAQAGAEFLAAEPMPIGEWEEIERELDEPRERGLDPSSVG